MTMLWLLTAATMFGHVIFGQMSFNKSCFGNFTGDNGSYSYRISEYPNCGIRTECLSSDMKIDLLGDESDPIRNLYISWASPEFVIGKGLKAWSNYFLPETHQRNSSISVLFIDLDDDMHTALQKCFHFHIYEDNEFSVRTQGRELRLDCLTIIRGVYGELRIHSREDSLTRCGANFKTIDTITCTCSTTNLSVAGSANHGDHMTVDFDISYTVASESRDMNISFLIEKDGERVGEPRDKLPMDVNGTLSFPVLNATYGIYTVKVNVYCLDWNKKERQDQICKTETFNITIIPPAVSGPKYRTLLLFVLVACITAALMVTGVIFCIVRMRVIESPHRDDSDDYNNIVFDTCRHCIGNYNPEEEHRPTPDPGIYLYIVDVIRKARISFMLNEELELLNRKYAILSHHGMTNKSEFQMEKQLLVDMSTNNMTVMYSSQHRHEAANNWQTLANDIVNECSHIVVILSDGLLNLLEHSSKESKTISEKETLGKILMDRNHENIPLVVLNQVHSILASRHMQRHIPELHITLNHSDTVESSLRRLFKVYNLFQLSCKVYGLNSSQDWCTDRSHCQTYFSEADLLDDLCLRR